MKKLIIKLHSDILPSKTNVEWNYRSAIGHGTIVGVEEKGNDHEHTKYKIEQHDDHPNEPKYVYHWGTALRVVK